MSRSSKQTKDKAISIPASIKEDFKHYEKLLGFNEAILLLVRREKASQKLQKLKAKNQKEQQASSRPDGRLNGYNIALGSLVAQMGGKRKAKKTKRGY